MKFKVGDRVRVARFSNDYSRYAEEQVRSHIKSIGTIVSIGSDYEFPIEILFDDNSLELVFWREEELELVEPLPSVDNERYVIELEDGNFGAFEQTQDGEVYVTGYKSFCDGSFFQKDNAKRVFEEMKNGSEWDYIGYCTKPKKIWKVIISVDEAE